jgi:hypothetical protein
MPAKQKKRMKIKIKLLKLLQAADLALIAFVWHDRPVLIQAVRILPVSVLRVIHAYASLASAGLSGLSPFPDVACKDHDKDDHNNKRDRSDDNQVNRHGLGFSWFRFEHLLHEK